MHIFLKNRPSTVNHGMRTKDIEGICRNHFQNRWSIFRLQGRNSTASVLARGCRIDQGSDLCTHQSTEQLYLGELAQRGKAKLRRTLRGLIQRSSFCYSSRLGSKAAFTSLHGIGMYTAFKSLGTASAGEFRLGKEEVWSAFCSRGS